VALSFRGDKTHHRAGCERADASGTRIPDILEEFSTKPYGGIGVTDGIASAPAQKTPVLGKGSGKGAFPLG
jgi:hypothetical protein